MYMPLSLNITKVNPTLNHTPSRERSPVEEGDEGSSGRLSKAQLDTLQKAQNSAKWLKPIRDNNNLFDKNKKNAMKKKMQILVGSYSGFPNEKEAEIKYLKGVIRQPSYP